MINTLFQTVVEERDPDIYSYLYAGEYELSLCFGLSALGCSFVG